MKCISMLLLMGLILVSDASAHSLYVEFPRDLSTDANAEFWIAYGHGGSADQEISSLPVARIVSPSGQPKELQMHPFQGGLKGDVAFPEPGCYILDMQMDSTFFDPIWFGSSGSRSLVEKYGRALLPVQSGKGFGWSSGTGLEIVPETDPYGLKSGEQFSAKALWNGKPVPGSYSAVIVRSPDDVLVVLHAQQTEQEGSSSDGSISITATRPGLWVLSYEATLDETGKWAAGEDDPQGHYEKGEQLSYEQIAPTAYLSFWVNK